MKLKLLYVLNHPEESNFEPPTRRVQPYTHLYITIQITIIYASVLVLYSIRIDGMKFMLR